MGLENLDQSENLMGQDGNLRDDFIETPEDGNLLANDEEVKSEGADSKLVLHLSQSLTRKLIAKASSEGVKVSDLAAELLSEGLVLRAWEIMERKTTMRGPSANNFNPQPSRNQNRQGFRGQGNGNGGNSYGNGQQSAQQGRGRGHGNGQAQNGGVGRRMNYSQIMDDSANFLEYVRSQEKKQK